MNVDQLTKLLEDVKNNKCDVSSALNRLKTLPYEDLAYAKVDHHREIRNGHAEVIYSPGKSLDQIRGIVENMLKNSSGNILASRAEPAVFDAIKAISPDAIYYQEARSVVVKRQEYKSSKDYILLVTAGTSDIPIAEEAAITAMVMGNSVKRLYDVGVAGIHRLLANMDVINAAKVVIVVAGMEGALASVIGGLTDKPIVAVPTSVGYGANFGGISALLGMLTSCASGIAVVNIDNGFGAACMASKINKL